MGDHCELIDSLLPVEHVLKGFGQCGRVSIVIIKIIKIIRNKVIIKEKDF